MGKRSGIALGIAAILLSAGFGGYVLYDNFINVHPSGNQWYKTTTHIEYMAASEAWLTATYLFIDFTVISGQTVYFSYVGQVLFDDSSGDTWVEIKFSVDGHRWDNPILRLWRYNTITPGGILFSVALQNYNTTMPPGSHNVTIAFHSDNTANALYYTQSLFVQTFT